jgi:AmmeMemoRadiSam system protein A
MAHSHFTSVGMPDGSARRGPVLIGIARDAIASEDEFAPPHWSEDWLRETGASFVTLKLDGELRGCIGTIDPRRALGDDVAANARAAAYRDPRFPPVSRAERERLEIEVSVLSAREPMTVASEADAVSRLRPGIDGIYLEYGHARSTFLPQVWESLPDPLEFLGELRRKAGLPARFWHPDVLLSRYTVEKFR